MKHKDAIYKTLKKSYPKEMVDLVLTEAEPHIEKMTGKVMVIKCSGTTIASQELMAGFANDIVCLHAVGIKPVVVHGGGKQINKELEEMGIQSAFSNGLRVTDRQTMDVVQDILLETINPELVDSINLAVEPAATPTDSTPTEHSIAIAGGLVFEAEQLDESLGFVGKVKSVQTQKLHETMAQGKVPVVSSIGIDEHGHTYNINADTAASELAIALEADRLHILTDVPGVYAKSENMTEGNHISELNLAQVTELLKSGDIAGGMIPKLEACQDALEGGVEVAHLLDGRKPGDLIVELFTDAGIGTMITREASSGESYD